MISLSALLTKYTLGIMSNLSNNVGGQSSAAEGSMDRGSCLLRYASQNSLDESSQKHVRRPNGKDRTIGSYYNSLHTIRSFGSMNEMRKQNLLCDVTLVADDIEIPAHKMVLASCSPYFYAMFTGFEESRQSRIKLQGVDHRALELLVEYVYTANVEVNEDNVQLLLTAANLLQLTDVREACCEYLQTQLDASNCLGIRGFADMHGCIDLVNYADQYIDQHFHEVIQSDEFLNLQYDQVINLIKSDRISVPSEETVYEGVTSWIQYDSAMRDQFIASLMEHVRLYFLSKEYPTQRVNKEALMEGNIVCDNLLDASSVASRPHPPNIKLPPFDEERPELWFATVELVFTAHGPIPEDLRAAELLNVLGPNQLLHVAQIIRSPGPTPYSDIKSSLLRALNVPQASRQQRLARETNITGLKPSHYLTHLRSIAGPEMHEDQIRPHFLRSLSRSTRAILTVLTDQSLSHLAQIADAIQAIHPAQAEPPTYQVAATNTRPPLPQLSSQPHTSPRRSAIPSAPHFAQRTQESRPSEPLSDNSPAHVTISDLLALQDSFRRDLNQMLAEVRSAQRSVQNRPVNRPTPPQNTSQRTPAQRAPPRPTRNGNPNTQNTPNNAVTRAWCNNHKRFGERTINCKAPCGWTQSTTRQGRRLI